MNRESSPLTFLGPPLRFFDNESLLLKTLERVLEILLTREGKRVSDSPEIPEFRSLSILTMGPQPGIEIISQSQTLVPKRVASGNGPT